MKRRTFITRALPLAAGAAALPGCAPSQTEGPAVITQPRIQWRMASSFPRSLDILYGAAEYFAARVSALTGGKLTIRLYPAGEIVPGHQVLDAVQQGTVQCGQTASYYYTGKHEALAFDTCVPFGLTTRQQFAWMYQGGGLELIREILADFNIISFPAGSTGAQMGGWFRRDIRSAGDLNGLKMRIPGLGGEVMSRMNVTVQLLSGAEVYLALERGAIDAVEWVGPHDDEKLGFHNIIKNYYYPGWWEPGAMLSHYVHKPSWERLPVDYQEAVAAACAETSAWMTAAYDAKNPEALARLLTQGVILKRFPDDVMTQAEKISEQLLREKADAQPAYRKVYEAWNAFREQSRRWFATAEFAQMDFALRQPDRR
ncbi:MAG TPA: TRAP transporter substrate-binding protein [Kiritimatiellia bacterium]|nr:TRAP transporter substrate-binding protein [Kiritimatiellia bacterium]HMO99461.1 TRAP transporter substrate-binding protein [Kiritimatiellia bacterium]HMP97251.1 TRAP transporter substrate-binding protein [Kiritimatiellia bacterium]